MYELKSGSARLVHALEQFIDNPSHMKQLANILYYCENQLVQDIEALRDNYNHCLSIDSS